MTPAQLAKNSTVRVTPGAFGANCELANGTDADHDINIGVGSCGDSTGTYQMTLLSTLVKQIDAGWAQGSAAGGLFSGSVATGTWYHVFVIRNDTTGAIDGGFDTSATAANRPAGWTAYCRVGAVLTDGSSNIIGFSQKEDQVLWSVTAFDVSGAAVGTSSVALTISTPLDVKVIPLIFLEVNPGGVTAGATYCSSLDVSDVAAVSGNINGSQAHANSNAFAMITGGNSLRTNTSSQVRLICDTAGGLAYGWTWGWNDPRGKVAA